MKCTKCGYISFDDLTYCSKCTTELASVAETLHGTCSGTEPEFFLASLVSQAMEGESPFEDLGTPETPQPADTEIDFDASTPGDLSFPGADDTLTLDTEDEDVALELGEILPLDLSQLESGEAPEEDTDFETLSLDETSDIDLTVDLSEEEESDLTDVDLSDAADLEEDETIDFSEDFAEFAPEEEQAEDLQQVDLEDVGLADLMPAETAEDEQQLPMDLGSYTDEDETTQLEPMEEESEDEIPELELGEMTAGLDEDLADLGVEPEEEGELDLDETSPDFEEELATLEIDEEETEEQTQELDIDEEDLEDSDLSDLVIEEQDEAEDTTGQEDFDETAELELDGLEIEEEDEAGGSAEPEFSLSEDLEEIPELGLGDLSEDLVEAPEMQQELDLADATGEFGEETEIGLIDEEAGNGEEEFNLEDAADELDEDPEFDLEDVSDEFDEEPVLELEDDTLEDEGEDVVDLSSLMESAEGGEGEENETLDLDMLSDEAGPADQTMQLEADDFTDNAGELPEIDLEGEAEEPPELPDLNEEEK